MTPSDKKFIINVLRKGSVLWPGRANCLKKARKEFFERVSKSGKKIFKFHWKCAACLTWFRNVSSMEVDHIVEVGPFNGSWDDFIPRLFCHEDNLQALCTTCHLKKTMAYSNARLRWHRKDRA